jgi:hypothetical protein
MWPLTGIDSGPVAFLARITVGIGQFLKIDFMGWPFAPADQY